MVSHRLLFAWKNKQSHKAMRSPSPPKVHFTTFDVAYLIGGPAVQVEGSGGAASRLGGSEGGSRGGEEGGDGKLVHDDGWL